MIDYKTTVRIDTELFFQDLMTNKCDYKAFIHNIFSGLSKHKGHKNLISTSTLISGNPSVMYEEGVLNFRWVNPDCKKRKGNKNFFTFSILYLFEDNPFDDEDSRHHQYNKSIDRFVYKDIVQRIMGKLKSGRMLRIEPPGLPGEPTSYWA